MSWFRREDHSIVNNDTKTVRTEGLWIKCGSCGNAIFKADLDANLQVCPKCGKHFRMDARERVANLLEPGYELVDMGLRSSDPLNFTDLKPYKRRLAEAQKKTGLDDAIVNAVGRIGELPVVLSVMEYAFIGGSMGAVVGETIARAVERAAEMKAPLVIISASGGARMMEGIASLMQLAKISAALGKLAEAGVPYVFRDDRPDHGRGDGEFRHAGRPEHRRAGGADRVCGAAGDRADDPAEAAGGFSAVGVSTGTRVSGCDRRAQEPESLPGQGTGVDGRGQELGRIHI